MYSAARLEGSTVVWALEITWAGAVYRWATKALSVSSDSGSVPYMPGLEEPDYEETLDLASQVTEGQSVPIEVVFPVDVRTWVARGHGLDTARGELSVYLVRNGSSILTYEQRIIHVSGRVTQPKWNRRNRPIGWAAFSLEEHAQDDKGYIIPATHQINAQSWNSSDDLVTVNYGKTYPFVIGSPGVYPALDASGTTTRVEGSPAYAVEATGGSADTLLIAGHDVVATNVTIIDGAGTVEYFDVTNTVDGYGQAVATVDVSAASLIDRTSSTFWVSWRGNVSGTATTLRSSYSPYSSSGLRELGQVLRALLARSSVGVDAGKWAAAQNYLDLFMVDTYINDPEAAPWDFIQSELLPLVPLSVRQSGKGLYPIVFDPRLAASTARKVREGPDFRRSTEATADRHSIELVSDVSVDYARSNGGGSKYRRSVRYYGNPLEGAERIFLTSSGVGGGTALSFSAPCLYTRVAYGRLGASLAEKRSIESTCDTATAYRLASDLAIILGTQTFPYEYDAADWYAWLHVGEAISMTDSEANQTDAIGIVVGKARIPAGWRFTVLYRDDPVYLKSA